MCSPPLPPTTQLALAPRGLGLLNSPGQPQLSQGMAGLPSGSCVLALGVGQARAGQEAAHANKAWSGPVAPVSQGLQWNSDRSGMFLAMLRRLFISYIYTCMAAVYFCWARWS